MVFTRSRKRGAGDGDGVMRTTRSSRSNVIIDNEPSALQPKAKRQRTTSTAATAAATTTARVTRKTRALKPVATNANSNKLTNGSSIALTKPTRGVKAKVVPKSTKIVVRPHRRTRTANQQSQSKTTTDEQPQYPKPQQRTLSTGATRADADDAKTTKATTITTKPVVVTKSTSSASLDTSEAETCSKRDSGNSSYQNGVPDDIDARDAHDPLSVTDYVEDMYKHFLRKEENSSVTRMYMGRNADGKQPNINESMRCILVDWLIEVHYKFKLFPETLYLTVNILDRFLSETESTITKRDLQLVGVTALLISAKYEEMYVPELRDLTYICDGAYTEARILRMEENILKTLHYNVTVPTPHTFLIRFLKAAHADKLMAQLACFLLDGTLLSLETVTCRWRPSQLAAAAILLARRQLGRHYWSPTLVAYSGYREEDVMPIAEALLLNKKRLEEKNELLALAKKYSKTKYGKVSHIVFLPLNPPFMSKISDGGDDSMDDSAL